MVVLSSVDAAQADVSVDIKAKLIKSLPTIHCKYNTQLSSKIVIINYTVEAQGYIKILNYKCQHI
jgi:hypothetical protein